MGKKSAEAKSKEIDKAVAELLKELKEAGNAITDRGIDQA